MSSLKYPRAGFVEAPRPAHEVALHLVAASLRSASAKLARLSRRLAQPAGRVAHPVPQLEFYAEAGAPEGALYLDGKLVGWVSGVQRL
ncbi:MAG: hypothetical protein ABI781_16625 [Burkholderiales bacterium]